MTVIPFPKPSLPSRKAVDDFKRVCDAEGLVLRDDEVTAALDWIEAELQSDPPKTAGPPRDDV